MELPNKKEKLRIFLPNKANGAKCFRTVACVREQSINIDRIDQMLDLQLPHPRNHLDLNEATYSTLKISCLGRQISNCRKRE
jgi:hypothetical protein